MAYIQAFAIMVAIVLIPTGCLIGDLAAHRLIAVMNMPTCNQQAETWLKQFPANYPLAAMPAFQCKQ